jgi:hypothetical protein
MLYMINHPRILSVLCLVGMWLMACAGLWIGRRFYANKSEDKDHLVLVVSATLTLLGLIIGFTFSMAATRYDQRRLYEEEEANAIGTEYVRTDLLPADRAAHVKRLLLTYLDTRIGFYESDYGAKVTAVNRQTTELQAQLWHSILTPALDTPTPVTALVVSGMNDVLNSQGYAQFSWWNRIPTSAWALMIAISAFSNLMIGYAARRARPGYLLLALPLVISISFFLISDIDSPRGGIIRVPPVDLTSLSQQLHAPNP